MTLRFFTQEQLGPRQALTPEGFLLCENVPLARTGVLLYADGEVPVDADGDGIIRVLRDPEDVFAPTAVVSFAGKPVCNDHPPEKVSPENWKEYSIGVILNPRRGDGAQFDSDFLFADLLITDRDAIKDVRDGKREVSAGYDAEYEQVRPGEGRQHLIIGNHVALVDRGRCGPRCAIGDSIMASRRKPAWFDAIMQAHKTNDEDKLVDTLEKVGEMLGTTWTGIGDPSDGSKSSDTGVHVHLHQGGMDVADPDDPGAGAPIPGAAAPAGAGAGAAAAAAPAGAAGAGGSMEEIIQRLTALERAVAILAQGEEGEADPNAEVGGESNQAESQGNPAKDPDDDPSTDSKGTKDSKATTDKRAAVGDSTSLRAPWQELITRAEFLAPGIKAPTFDAKMSAKVTTDAMCKFRRKVLAEAMKEDDTKQAIEHLAGSDPKLAQMTCDSVQLIYNGASELMRQANTRDTVGTGTHVNGMNADSLVDTVKLINQRNRERYGIKA